MSLDNRGIVTQETDEQDRVERDATKLPIPWGMWIVVLVSVVIAGAWFIVGPIIFAK